jgi:RHS repeat-associated protein
MSRLTMSRFAGGIALFTAVTMVASLQAVPPAQARPVSPAESGPVVVSKEKPDTRGVAVHGVRWRPPAVPSQAVPSPVWPKPGVTRVSLRPAGAATATTHGTSAAKAQSNPGAVPVQVTGKTAALAAAQADVQILDPSSVPATWRSGLVTRIAPIGATGPGAVSVDYGTFAHAHGADWASRLRLYQLPRCALTTPNVTGCQAVPLPSRNSEKTHQVTATVTLAAAAQGGTVVALAAGASGDSGDFTATPLAASATWTAGGNSGGFFWSYPMRTPPGMGGPAPDLSLDYSSASVDGRTEATNNQPSEVGEGFDLRQSYIARQYVPCSDDDLDSETKAKGKPNTPTRTGDLCWGSWNASLSLGGTASQLVALPRATAGDPPTRYRTRTETGDVIERLTGTDNGTHDGEYWKVTTNDGTQYFFGRNKLPGQTTTTNSAWSVPVYGNHPTEPCHATAFADSSCTLAWRWNLDYVIDRYGNTESLWYDKETNQYAAAATETKPVPYDRAGFLSRIDYGTWDRVKADGTVDRSIDPSSQVILTAGDRCLSDCATHDEAHWPDTLWDQECKADAKSCPNQYSPTFWSTKRLASVTTRVWDITKTTPGWQNVDTWTLAHSFPRSGDGTHRGLWLASIVHSGEVGTSTPLPAVYFTPQALPNRVLTSTNTTLNWQRLNQIRTETGELITVTYSQRECTNANHPADPANNTMRCYPTIGPDPANPGKDLTQWWHKYTVSEVSESDLQLTNHQEQPSINTYYTYEEQPAWHYADPDGLTKPKYRTWDQWRGYSVVSVRVADTDQSLTRTTYLRGMDGDRKSADGGTRDITVDASLGSETVRDSDAFAGMVRESTTYNGSDDKPVAKTVNVPWQSNPTATQTVSDGTLTARFADVQTVYSATALGDHGERGWRTTKTHTSFDDDYGVATAVDDAGNITTTGDEKCITTTYDRNVPANMVTMPKRVLTTALPCATAPTAAKDIIADTVYTHDSDGGTLTTQQFQGWTSSGGTVYQTTLKKTYDAFGREQTTTDARNNVTQTDYTPTGRGPVTKIKTTLNPTSQKWATTTTMTPYWGTTVSITDPNGRIHEQTFDPLGRVNAVWNVGWPKTKHPALPSVRYTYCYQPDPSNNTACTTATSPDYTYIKTDALNAGGGLTTSYQIYDALLRLRQTQSTTPNKGERVVTDTIYDDHGRPQYAYAAHAEAGAPSGTLLWKPLWSHREVSQTIYDQANRATNQILLATNNVDNLVEKWRTTTAYGGDRTMVTPPAGGTPTTTIIDAHGRTVELREHTTSAGVNGAYQATIYHYDPRDHLASVEDALHNTWTYIYDDKGRLHIADDPDKGRTVTDYDELDQVLHTTDANGHELTYHYDSLGRKDAIYDGDAIDSAKQRAGWTYDKLPDGTVMRGQPISSTRYDADHNAYTMQVETVNTRYQPYQVTYHLPASEGLGTSWSISYAYADSTGAPTDVLYPGVTGYPQENVTTKYDSYSGVPIQLTTLYTDIGSYVTGQSYTSYGEPSKTVRQTAGGQRYEELYDYDIATRRLHNVKVTSGTLTNQYANRTYAYNPAGDVTSITDAPTTGQADTQCFAYDGLRRLTTAWTPKPVSAGTATPDTDCQAAPNKDNLGGAAPYWSDWTFDQIGNRTQQVDHKLAGDTTPLKYIVPDSGPGSVHPHAVTGITDSTGATTASYGYDDAGNMKSRPGQTLAWDSEGKLSSVTDSTGSTSYLYDADGSRLIQRDKTGSTLYLPGLEIRHDKTAAAGAFTETRYYSFAGQIIATATSTARKPIWLFNDTQGTESLAIADLTGQATNRRQTPYGQPRGDAGNNLWPTTKGFVGGDTDPTGLTHLGAREYDPNLGRFISVDPVQDLTSPQQWNGYSYANNNPTSLSDPTGTDPCSVGGQGCNTQGESGTFYPTPEDAVANHDKPRTGGKTTKQPTKSLSDPALGTQEPPIGFLRTNGYTGSTKFTYAEAIAWSKTSKLAATYVCEHVFNQSNEACGDHTAYMKNEAPLWVELITFFVAVAIGGFVRGREGIAEDPWAPPRTLDELPATADTPAEGATAAETDDAMAEGLDIDVNDLKLSRTVQEHTGDITKRGTPARPYNESRLTMQEIMMGSTPRPDPGGVPGGLRWDTPGSLNGKQGTWELVIDTRTNTVLHYNFVR